MKTRLLFFSLLMLAMGGSLFAQNSANGNISATSTNCFSVASSCVWESPLPPNAGTSTVAISGTFSATLLVEESNDGGKTWATAATLSAVGTTTYSTNGFTDIRVRCSAYTSGTAVVTISTGLLQVQSVVAGGSSSSSSVTCASTTNFPMAVTFITDFFLNLNCNVSTSNMTGTLVAGNEAVFTITQDATGGRTFAWPAGFLNTPTLNTAANGTTVATFQYCGSVGNGNACPANSWQNTDVGPTSVSSAATVIDAASYGVVGNGKSVNDATWLITSNLVNSATANWTVADIGKDFIGTDTCAQGVSSEATSLSRFPTGTTITGVNSATQITVSNNSSAAIASGGCVVYGKNQDTALAATNTAAIASPTCPLVLFPQGIIMFKTGVFNTNPVVCPRNNPAIPGGQPAGLGMEFKGQGKGVTIFVPMPGFTGCGSGCIFSGIAGSFVRDLSISGFGQINSHDIGGSAFLDMGTLSKIENCSFAAYASDPTGTSVGVRFAGGGFYNEMNSTSISAFGANGGQLKVLNSNLTVHMVTMGDGYGNNGQVIIDGTGGISQIISTGGFIACANTQNTLGWIKVINGGTYYSGNGDFFHTCGAALAGQKMLNIVDSTSSAFLSGYNNFSTNALNSFGIFNAGTLVINTDDLIVGGSGTGFAIDNASTGVIVDHGKWRCCGDGTTNVRNQVGGIWSGPNTLQGSGTGVGTAASTLGLYGLGQQAATTLTSTVVNLGPVMNKSGTLVGVSVTATAAGTNASSGVVTVLKNGVATAITCTIGTGTSCVDFTHATAYALDDVISVQVTTQAADTLAGIKASIVKN